MGKNIRYLMMIFHDFFFDFFQVNRFLTLWSTWPKGVRIFSVLVKMQPKKLLLETKWAKKKLWGVVRKRLTKILINIISNYSWLRFILYVFYYVMLNRYFFLDVLQIYLLFKQNVFRNGQKLKVISLSVFELLTITLILHYIGSTHSIRNGYP